MTSPSVTQQPKETPTATPTLVASPTPAPDGALVPDNLPPGAVAEPFVPGALQPSALAFAADGRLFYAEQHTGKIRVVQNGVVLPAPFFQLLVSDQAGSGLLGLTLDPNFSTNHYLYAFYTAPKTGTGATGPSGVVRLTDANNTGTDLQRVLSNLPPVSGQNSGALRFGPDGELYVGLPDDDTNSSAQDLGSLAGKILRVNPDGSAPTDNPFVGQAGKLDVIWAFGLHHPTSLAFHPIGHLLLGVDNLTAQKSDALEVISRGSTVGDPLALIKPSISPSGSTFYLGDQFPGWKNDWFYCGAGQKELRHVRLAAESFDRIVSEEVVKLGCTNDVATGPDGALYYSDAQGIYRIRMPEADVLPSVSGVES
jgi:glucose/arabinose dehydrogenase